MLRARRLPRELATLIDACLATDPDDRPTIDDVHARLAALVSEREPATAEPHPV